MTYSPKEGLKKAREAYRDGNYAKSLEAYEYFFDNAVDHDPSMGGVRSSYCLSEWAKLGSKYPEAQSRLEKRRDRVLEMLKNIKEVEHFADYVAICKYLGTPSLPVDLFIHYHVEDPEFASQVAGRIKWALLDQGHWKLCSHYLVDPMEEYSKAIATWDELEGLNKKHPEFSPPAGYVVTKFLRDVYRILIILKNVDRQAEAIEIRNCVSKDLASRGHSELYSKLVNCVEKGQLSELIAKME